MADRLTQLQDALDQILTQMFASITYIDTRHPASSIPNQVDQHQNQPAGTTAAVTNNSNSNAATAAANEAPPAPFDPDNRHNPEQNPQEFQSNLRELAQDLVLKQAQIEVLVDSLPGLGNSKAEQERRIEELEGELQQVEKERAEARKEREQLLRLVESRIVAARRV